ASFRTERSGRADALPDRMFPPTMLLTRRLPAGRTRRARAGGRLRPVRRLDEVRRDLLHLRLERLLVAEVLLVLHRPAAARPILYGPRLVLDAGRHLDALVRGKLLRGRREHLSDGEPVDDRLLVAGRLPV